MMKFWLPESAVVIWTAGRSRLASALRLIRALMVLVISFCRVPPSSHSGLMFPTWQVISNVMQLPHCGFAPSHLLRRRRHVQQPSPFTFSLAIAEELGVRYRLLINRSDHLGYRADSTRMGLLRMRKI